MTGELVRISRFLSYVLRHRPDAIDRAAAGTDKRRLEIRDGRVRADSRSSLRGHTDGHLGGRPAGDPVVLAVDAGGMRRLGHAFFLAANGVWLTDHVPAEFIVACLRERRVAPEDGVRLESTPPEV